MSGAGTTRDEADILLALNDDAAIKYSPLIQNDGILFRAAQTFRSVNKRRSQEVTAMLKTPKAIKRDILSKFRSQLDDHDTIPPKWLQEDYWQLLTSQEKSHFDQAVSDLTKKGLIEKVNDSFPTLRLTDKGADLIC